MLDKDNPDSSVNTKTHWISINAKGYKGEITSELKEFLDYINYGLTKNSSNFIKKIDRERLDYIRSTEWRDAKMSLAVLLSDERAEARKEGRKEGKLEAQKIAVKNFVQSVQDFNPTQEWLF